MEANYDLEAIFGMMTGIIITLGLFTMFVLIVYYIARAKNKERMALIEKGIDLSTIYRKKDRKDSFFKVGVIVVGLSVGLLFGMLLSQIQVIPPFIAYFAMILLFGGIGILAGNYLSEKKNK